MSSGEPFDDFLAEELAHEPELARELDESFADMRLAVQLAMCREKRGMSQQALAHVTGILQPMISRIERGEQEPTWPTLRKLLHGLHASLAAGPDGEVLVVPSEEGVIPLSAEAAPPPGPGVVRVPVDADR